MHNGKYKKRENAITDKQAFPKRGWNQIMPGRERHSQGRHGEEVAVSGALKSTIGREEPRTAHALHTSHTLVIRRPCQKCRF